MNRNYKLKRVHMPLNFRMQDFMLFGHELFWTSGSHTIVQKIKRWLTKDHSKLCNTSRGFTLPSHGQTMRKHKGLIQDYATGKVFTLKGDCVRVERAPNLSSVPNRAKYRQGIVFVEDKPSFILYGSPGTGSIEVTNKNGDLLIELFFKDYKKWYWKYWEAEGIAINEGKIFIGISVKTKFGVLLNYVVNIVMARLCENIKA